jgi:hypothetical protein
MSGPPNEVLIHVLKNNTSSMLLAAVVRGGELRLGNNEEQREECTIDM